MNKKLLYSIVCVLAIGPVHDSFGSTKEPVAIRQPSIISIDNNRKPSRKYDAIFGHFLRGKAAAQAYANKVGYRARTIRATPVCKSYYWYLLTSFITEIV